MKVLSIREPWASMILNGEKTIETRTWNTHHRGLILLCACKKPVSEISGKAFAIAKIVDCKEMVKADELNACCEVYHRAKSWFLEDVKPIPPFDVKGQLMLFEVDYDAT